MYPHAEKNDSTPQANYFAFEVDGHWLVTERRKDSPFKIPIRGFGFSSQCQNLAETVKEITVNQNNITILIT